MNWIVRYKRGYIITANSDFLLAVIVFDAGVIFAVPEVEHLVNYPEFRHIIIAWHMMMGITALFLWYSIVRWAEPAFETHHRLRHGNGSAIFPVWRWLSCTFGTLLTVVLQTGFFVYQRVTP
jgi:PAS domain-containing protein